MKIINHLTPTVKLANLKEIYNLYIYNNKCYIIGMLFNGNIKNFPVTDIRLNNYESDDDGDN